MEELKHSKNVNVCFIEGECVRFECDLCVIYYFYLYPSLLAIYN